jgi:pyruvate dehydrogenase E2 component (dihydrolipoamide acetyltransferase)
MSVFEFKLPDIGEGVMEGEIVAWHVAAGQKVAEDEPMVEVMTDKATVTIGAPKTGTVSELRAKVGDVVPVGAIIVTLDTNGSARAAQAPAPAESGTKKHVAPPPAKESAATAVGDIKESLPGTGFFAQPRHREEVSSEKPLATPATRKLARDLDIDLRLVPGSGEGGRVTKEDVQSYAGGGREAPTQPGMQIAPVPTRVVADAPASRRAPIAVANEDGDERKPFVGIRRRIAERMQTAKNTAAHFTFVEECDVGKLKELRDRLRGPAERAGVKLSFLPFIVKAVVAALKKHPALNSALDEATNEIVFKRSYHIGVAAATEQGLLVPVVRDADKKSVLEVARDIDRLAALARDGKIAPHELSGSTFTVTSLGKLGGLFATPILNHPEVAILGVHQMKERAVVKDGQIVIGNIMLLSLSFDHRLVDGHIGAAFAYEVIGYLEEPDRLFLEMA